MADKNERLELLLIFDCIAVLLSTFGVILAFKVMNMDVTKDLAVISLFFIGVKILVMALGDLTKAAKGVIAAGFFILLADFAIIVIDYLMAFGISSRMLLVTAGADLVVIIISHLIWKKKHGSAKGKKSDRREQKQWLGQSRRGHFNEDDDAMDDIFNTLTGDEAGSQGFLEGQGEMPGERLGDADAFYDLDQADREDADVIRKSMDYTSGWNPASAPMENEEAEEDDGIAFDGLGFDDGKKAKTAPAELPAEEAKEDAAAGTQPAEEMTGGDELDDLFEEVVDEPEEKAGETPGPEHEESVKEPVTFSTIEPLAEKPEMTFFEDEEIMPDGDQPSGTVPVASEEESLFEEDEEPKTGDFSRLEERLGTLVSDIGDDSVQSQKFKSDVDAFREELANLGPVTSNAEILQTGEVIREKLKNIMDKQSLVDGVLDDLIRLSQQINLRIDDLDKIEANLNQREKVLNEREEREKQENQQYVAGNVVNQERAAVNVLPEEVMLDSGDSEIIIDEEDLELIRQYLEAHPDM